MAVDVSNRTQITESSHNEQGMCPEAVEYLQSGIKCQRLGLLDRALVEFVTAVGLADDPDLRSVAMTHQSNVLRAQCQWQSAIEVARQSRTIAMHAGLETRAAEAWIAEANVYLARGEFEAALPVFHALLESTTDARLRGVALQNIGNIRAQCGVFQQAESAFSESFRCFEHAGFLPGQAIARTNQGRARLDRGDLAGAVTLLEDAVKFAKHAEDGELVASALINLAEALLPTDPERAEDLACTALGHFRSSGNHLPHLECLRLLGDVNARRGHGDEAVACYEKALLIARKLEARVEVTTLERRIREVAQRSGAADTSAAEAVEAT